MSQARYFLLSFWNLRRSERREQRVAWWGVVVCAAVLVVAIPLAGPGLVIALWGAANLVLMVMAILWGLLHPRAVLAARNIVMVWAVWLAALSGAATFGFIEHVLANAAFDVQEIFQRQLLMALSSAVVSFLLLLVSFVAFGFSGAALSAFAWRGHDQRDAARIGARAGWITALIVVPLATLFGDGNVSFAIVLGMPTFVLGMCALIRHSEYDPKLVARRMVTALAQRLICRKMLRGHERTFDLRGAALGLAAGVLALVLTSTPLLLPLQARSLAWLMQTRIEFLPPLRSENPLVLLAMDARVRREALTTKSEAAVQAEIIRKLGAQGAKRIVLPLPLLEMRNTIGRNKQAVEQERESIARNVRDLPGLEAAMRAAGNVVLALPQHLPARERVEKTRAAALESGRMDLDSYGLLHLPALSTKESIPLALLAAIRSASSRPSDSAGPLRARPISSTRVEFAGMRMPLIAPGSILVNFPTSDPDNYFPRISYSSLIAGEPVNETPEFSETMPKLKASSRAPWQEYFSDLLDEASEWESVPHDGGDDYFKGKIVFLDRLQRRTRQTPLGAMSPLEVQAFATGMLLSKDFIEREGPLMAALNILLCGLLVGQVCVRRDPIAAGLRAGVVALFVFGAAVVAFVSKTWADPVGPLVATLGAYLLVTQFTFSLERAEHERLSELMKLRDQAVREVAHELKNPLATVQGSAATILYGMERGLDLKTQREMLELCVTTCKRLTRLLNNMLDTARMKAGHEPELRVAETDLAALVESVLASQRMTTTNHRLEFEHDRETPMVAVDADKVYQVLTNIVNNAIKYSPEGGEVRVRLWGENGETRLSVADQGIGMTPAQQQKLFQPFSRVIESDRRITGTGIGLHLVKRLVEAHGGRIWVSSEYGTGSTFTVALPHAAAESNGSGVHSLI